MRKWLIGLILTVSLLCISLLAQAETFVLDELMATVEIPETYVVITPDNISTYSDWLAERGISSEDLVNNMLGHGILLQAWDKEDDTRRFELTATQDEQTLLVFDVNEQSEDYRRSYRTSYYPGNEYGAEGYTFSTSNWKHADNGRFLILEYIMRQYGEIDHRGYMRRTIRNGYEITLDMQVYGRRLTAKDNTALNKIWDTFKFVEILGLPAAASSHINITSTPPMETHDPNVSINGTAAEGVTFKAVLMGLNYDGKIQNEVTVGAGGSFSIPFELPKNGVFMITVEAEYNGETVAQLKYDIVYSSSLLVVNITSNIPEVVTSDSITITGTAEPKASLQVFVNDEKVADKKVSTDGKFTVDLDTSEEGHYDVVLAFSETTTGKKILADRNYNISFTRSWSTEDMINRIKSDAVSPNYATLVDNVARYDGRTVGYKCYLVEVQPSGGDWIYKMALSKSGDTYSNFILVVASEEPAYDIGTRLMMYGTSVGMSVAGETGQAAADETVPDESYPCFELLLLLSIE